MFLKRYNALLFDLDGTLVDTMHIWEESYRLYFKETGMLHGKDVEKFIGLLRRGGDPVVEMFPGIERRERDRIYEGVRKVLLKLLDEGYPIRRILEPEELLSFGVPLGVVTQTNRSVAKRILKTAQLYDVIDEMVTSDMVNNVKPHPEPLEKALSRLGVFDAPYIGDSEADELAAIRAGIDFYHIKAVVKYVRRGVV